MLILAKVIERLQLDTPSLQLDIVRAVFGTGFPQHHRYMLLLVYVPIVFFCANTDHFKFVLE